MQAILPTPRSLYPEPLIRTVAHAHVSTEESKVESEGVWLESPTLPLSVLATPTRSLGVLVKPRMAGGASLPPIIQGTPLVKRTFRFRNSSTLVQVGCGLGGVLGALGSICTVTNSKVRTVASSIRIHSITMWLPAGTTGDGGFIDWGNAASAGYVKDDSKISTIPDGVTETRALLFKPPGKTLCGDWLNPSVLALSTALFFISAPTGAIFDLHVSYTLSNVNNGVDQTVATGVLGAFYYLSLDGAGGNQIVPVGLTTTH
jgi:hypothetical protein